MLPGHSRLGCALHFPEQNIFTLSPNYHKHNQLHCFRFLKKNFVKGGSFNLLCNIKSFDAINQCHENENFTKLKCLHYSCPPVKPGQLALELSNLAGLYLADGALGVAAPVPPLLFSGDHLYPLRMLVSGPPPRRLLVIIVSRGLMMRGSG